jgi:hypothetical protein
VTEEPSNRLVQERLDPETRWQIAEVLSRYGHIVDNQEWTHLTMVFTVDATFDAQDTVAAGLSEIQPVLEASGPWRSHHTLNTITKYSADKSAITAWSRFLVVEASGTTMSGDYVDTFTRTPEGWRIRSRRLSLRNRPDKAPDGQPWRTESFTTWDAR